MSKKKKVTRGNPDPAARINKAMNKAWGESIGGIFQSNPVSVDLNAGMNTALEEMNSAPAFQAIPFVIRPVKTEVTIKDIDNAFLGNAQADPVTHFNHNPFVTEVWVERQGWRFKDPYLVRLKDGTEIEGYPNGGGFSLSDNRIVEDEEVTHLKLLQNPDFRRAFNGARKLVRQFEFFGTRYPAWVDNRFVKLEDLPEGYRFEPVEVYAYRDKEKNVKVLISKANIVEEHSGAPRLTDILEYANDPHFWWDEDSQILNHDDIQRAIRHVYLAREHYKVNFEEAKWLDEFCMKHNMHMWKSVRHILVQALGKEGKEVFTQIFTPTVDQGPSILDAVLPLSMSDSQKKREILNELRGSKSAYDRNPFTMKLINTLQNPEQLPSYLKGL